QERGRTRSSTRRPSRRNGIVEKGASSGMRIETTSSSRCVRSSSWLRLSYAAAGKGRFLLNGISIGRRTDTARKIKGSGHQHTLINAISGAILGEFVQIPHLTDRHTLQRNQPPVLKSHCHFYG